MDTQLMSNELVQLDKYFQSCNALPVTRATIPAAEWHSFRAKLDMLMLEYCPEEMNQEQFNTWASHQRVV